MTRLSLGGASSEKMFSMRSSRDRIWMRSLLVTNYLRFSSSHVMLRHPSLSIYSSTSATLNLLSCPANGIGCLYLRIILRRASRKPTKCRGDWRATPLHARLCRRLRNNLEDSWQMILEPVKKFEDSITSSQAIRSHNLNSSQIGAERSSGANVKNTEVTCFHSKILSRK